MTEQQGVLKKTKKSPVKKNKVVEKTTFISPAVTFIPTVTYPMVEQWFKAFYCGEYGEMILGRIINFYKFFKSHAPLANIIYLSNSNSITNMLDIKDGPIIDLYRMMNDFNAQRIELCMIDPFELED